MAIDVRAFERYRRSPNEKTTLPRLIAGAIVIALCWFAVTIAVVFAGTYGWVLSGAEAALSFEEGPVLDRLGLAEKREDRAVMIGVAVHVDEPCAGVAHGLSRNLIERAADVMLKERRKLILLPRETPMSLPQLRNMVLCAEAGALLMPAMPAFYQMPRTLDDLANFMAGKILAALGFEHELYPAWKG